MYNMRHKVPPTNLPMEWEQITKIVGPSQRHIEQLWDEVNKLKERINELEKTIVKIDKRLSELSPN